MFWIFGVLLRLHSLGLIVLRALRVESFDGDGEIKVVLRASMDVV